MSLTHPVRPTSRARLAVATVALAERAPPAVAVATTRTARSPCTR